MTQSILGYNHYV